MKLQTTIIAFIVLALLSCKKQSQTEQTSKLIYTTIETFNATGINAYLLSTDENGYEVISDIQYVDKGNLQPDAKISMRSAFNRTEYVITNGKNQVFIEEESITNSLFYI